MSRSRHTTDGRRRAKAVFVGLAILFAAALCRADEPNLKQLEQQKAEVLRNVAQNWIQVGISQYKRGLYEQAEKAFLFAREYQEYLSDEQQEQLKQHLAKAHQARVESRAVREHLDRAKELLKQGKAIEARAHYEKVRNNPYLTERQRRQIARQLEAVDEKLDRRKEEITELYNHSVELYRAGHLEKAREGFVEVARYGLLVSPEGQSAEDYLVQIDDILTRRYSSNMAAEATPPPAVEDDSPAIPGDTELQLLQPAPEQRPAEKQQETEQPLLSPEELAEVTAVAEPQQSNEDTTAENTRTKIIRTYTKAVIEDTAVKVGYYIGRGQLDEAVAQVRTATETLKQNRALLGDELFIQYTIRLTRLADRIIRAGKTPQNPENELD